MAGRGHSDDMAVRCAWCGRVSQDGVFVESDEVVAHGTPRVDERTSHGICPECFARELARRSQKKN